MKWMSQKHVDLGSGSVGRLLLSLAAPTITSQIVNMLYNLVDRVYIGHMQPTDTVGKLASPVLASVVTTMKSVGFSIKL